MGQANEKGQLLNVTQQDFHSGMSKWLMYLPDSKEGTEAPKIKREPPDRDRI